MALFLRMEFGGYGSFGAPLTRLAQDDRGVTIPGKERQKRFSESPVRIGLRGHALFGELTIDFPGEE